MHLSKLRSDAWKSLLRGWLKPGPLPAPCFCTHTLGNTLAVSQTKATSPNCLQPMLPPAQGPSKAAVLWLTQYTKSVKPQASDYITSWVLQSTLEGALGLQSPKDRENCQTSCTSGIQRCLEGLCPALESSGQETHGAVGADLEKATTILSWNSFVVRSG